MSIGNMKKNAPITIMDEYRDRIRAERHAADSIRDMFGSLRSQG
jgi:hypothetical protein